MSKFKKKANVKQEIPTSSMPDVVFMLLFFFMVTTTMRDTSINVLQRIPEASQMRKLLRKSLVAYLYVGQPKKIDRWGKEPKIQANDAFIQPREIINWVNNVKSEMPEAEQNQLTVALKVDSDTKRGIIVDIETELRKANARKLLYSSNPKRAEF